MGKGGPACFGQGVEGLHGVVAAAMGGKRGRPRDAAVAPPSVITPCRCRTATVQVAKQRELVSAQVAKQRQVVEAALQKALAEVSA